MLSYGNVNYQSLYNSPTPTAQQKKRGLIKSYRNGIDWLRYITGFNLKNFEMIDIVM